MWESFRFAFAGLRYAWRTQRNLRIHMAITVVVMALAGWLRFDPVRWAVLILTIALVWAAELLNTALEAIVDLASPSFHPLARIAKDVSAGMVLLCAIAAVLVGLALFGPGLWALLSPWS
ncbi:MAG: diacylglycerol kinase family protein [Anaerolineae bacterium]|uniref:diacylglycerol kinase family protein n=1 Tax=Thermoflexus sp. TaxID=1969742 RepID=UPI0025CB8E1D|nr:diacylglycerol kinase family protein [Thermoflexus sp.]MCS7351677.1 diacylglycerol kinase family protein [Thermoflexus sp.]MDW8181135.1 diacylglycerol kinase family protein [Anaerolineae bacterium]